MVPPTSHKVPRVSWYSGSRSLPSGFAYGAFTLFGRVSQPVWLPSVRFPRPVTPACSHAGLGSSHFARRYFGNRSFFLFLRLLRCFSSAGSLRMPMDSAYGACVFRRRVSPFRHPRISGYLLLPGAFRSLSRLSSALSAKASTLRSFLLDRFWLRALFTGALSPDV